MIASISILLFVFTAEAFAHGGGEASIEVGPGKGVTEVSKDKSFRLAPEAVKRLEISFSSVTSSNVQISKSAIANSLKDSRIFRLREGWIKSIPYKVVNKTNTYLNVYSHELKSGDQIVQSGVGFLRIIASQLGEAEEEGEEHSAHSEHKDEHHDDEHSGEHHD